MRSATSPLCQMFFLDSGSFLKFVMKFYKILLKNLVFLMFRPLKMGGGELCSRVCFSFFQAKSATTNNSRTGLSDISY